MFIVCYVQKLKVNKNLKKKLFLVTCLGVEWAAASGTEWSGSPGSVVMAMDLRTQHTDDVIMPHPLLPDVSSVGEGPDNLE